MRITYITFGTFTPKSDGTLTSDFASTRYRVLIPAQTLKDRGHQIQIFSVRSGEVTQEIIDAVNADVVIFNKSYFSIDSSLAKQAQANGAQVVMDLSDNHFANPKYGSPCKEMADLANLITCTTPTLAKITSRHTATPCTVIDDPYEGPVGIPRFSPDPAKLKVLWFGHSSNLVSLLACIDEFPRIAKQVPMHLTLVSEQVDGMHKFCGILNQAIPGRLSASLITWSTDALWRALQETDLVIIPSADSEILRTKSPNRVFESLRAGRMVVTQPLPSYEQFRKWIRTSENIRDAVLWAVKNRDSIPGRIEEAQKYVEEKFAPSVVGRQWELALEKLLEKEKKGAHAYSAIKA